MKQDFLDGADFYGVRGASTTPQCHRLAIKIAVNPYSASAEKCSVNQFYLKPIELNTN